MPHSTVIVIINADKETVKKDTDEMKIKHRILIIEADIRLFDTHSLKEKRSIKRQLFDRITKERNISLAETRHHELWQRLAFTIAYVAIDEASAGQAAISLRDFCEDIIEGQGEILSFSEEII
jgi:uncharacterized protein YlxP (DUF503 family)